MVFVPDFNVKNGQPIYPAAELSEQISTAGKEASGTGNMKFAMNGALTIGTLDGANVEIREAVGPENFFLFGLDVEGIRRLRAGGYRPRDLYESDPVLRAVIDALADGTFSRGDAALFRPVVESAAGRGPLAARGRLPLVRRKPGGGGAGLPRPRPVDADVDPEHGADGLLLVRPLDRRLLPGCLARDPGTHRAGRPGRGQVLNRHRNDRAVSGSWGGTRPILTSSALPGPESTGRRRDT